MRMLIGFQIGEPILRFKNMADTNQDSTYDFAGLENFWVCETMILPELKRNC